MLKKNQTSLYENVELLFNEAILKRFSGFNASPYSPSQPGHEREESSLTHLL